MPSYADKLKDPRWQRKRLEILQREDFNCEACGSYSMYVPGLNPFWTIAESDHCRCRQRVQKLEAGIREVLPDLNCRMLEAYHEKLGRVLND